VNPVERTFREEGPAVLATLILPGLFYAGTHWGTAGVAAAWVVGHPTCVLPLFLFAALRVTGLSLAGYVKALWPAAEATLVMAAAVLALRWATPGGWPVSVRLVTQVLTGVGAYGGTLYLAHRPRVRALWALVRELRG